MARLPATTIADTAALRMVVPSATLRANVRVSAADRFSAGTLILEVGQLTEEVSVSGRVSELETQSGERSYTPESEALRNIANNGRAMFNFATLVPGVNSSLADEVGIGLTNVVSVSIAGARRNVVNWFVDGAPNVDVGSNVTLLSTPTLESIEEFKIITSGYAAEWPRSGGGIINAPIVRGSAINGHGGSARDKPNPFPVIELSLSTDSLRNIPSTWFTHFRIWGSAPRCPGKSVSRWMNASASSPASSKARRWPRCAASSASPG